MRLYRELTNVQNGKGAVAGLNAQIICPVRYTYDYILLEYTGTGVTRAMLTDIQVLANGEPIWNFKDGDRLDQWNDYYGRSDTAGFLMLPFNRREMKSLGDERIFGLGTADLDTLSVQIKMGATTPADFSLKAHAQLSEPQPLGVFCRVKEINYNSAVSGQVDVDKIPLGPRIMALHAFKSDVADLEVYLNEVKIWDLSKTVGEVFEKNFGRTPQTAVATHADWLLEGDAGQAMITEDQGKRNDLLIKPTLTTAGAVTFLVEYLDTLKQVA